MAILVTGGAGFIGSHMVLQLLDQGEQVVIIDDLSTGNRAGVPDEATLFVGDVGNSALLSRVFRQHSIDSIFHFAGSTVVPESVVNPLKYFENNTAKSRNLLAAAVRAKVRFFVFSSTAAVYGNVSSAPVSEKTPLSPASPYGTSKMMTEMMLRAVAAAHPLRYAVLRYFNVAGADPLMRCGQSTPNATHLIKVAAEASVGSRNGILIYGTDYPTPDGTCIRDYIHVVDLVAAHSAALRHLRAGGRDLILNCGYGRGYSVLEVLDTAKRIGGINFPTRVTHRRPGDAASVVADARRLRRTLGWTPHFDHLDLIVQHAIEWERRLKIRQLDLPRRVAELPIAAGAPPLN